MDEVKESLGYGLQLWPFAIVLAIGVFLSVLGGGALIGFLQGEAAKPPVIIVVVELVVGSILSVAGFFGALHHLWY